MKKFVIILLSLFCGLNVLLGQVRFDRFDISSGLSQNNINAMEFDDFGMLWIGTLDGLNRFNGEGFEIIKPGRSIRGQLSGNHILALGKGANGNMWIASRDGMLNVYDAAQNSYRVIAKSNFDQFNLSQCSLLSQAGDSLLLLLNNNVLGIWGLADSVFTTLRAPENIRGIEKVNNRVLVYGTFGIFELLGFANNYRFNKLTTLPCYAAHVLNGDFYWLNEQGISLFKEHPDKSDVCVDNAVFSSQNVNLHQISELLFDGEKFWLGAYGFFGSIGFENDLPVLQQFVYNPQVNHSFRGYSVSGLRIDDSGNIWIGTAKNGLNLINRTKNQFAYHEWDQLKLSDAESNPVRAICKTHNDELWLGFDRKGIGVIFSEGKQTFYTHYLSKNGEQHEITNVRIIFEDSQKNIWIGEEYNLCYFNRSKNRIETIDRLFDFSWPYRCYSIKELEYGTVSITSTLNIGFVNLATGKLSTIANQHMGAITRDFVQDKYRNFWVAKNDMGLVAINYPELDQTYINSETAGLSDNKVYCLAISGDSLWVGTNSGLNLVDVKSKRVVKQFFESDGLCNNIVYSIYLDENTNLWMSTNRGIAHYRVNEQRFVSFLPNDFFMDDAHFAHPLGTIYYGGYTGVVSFNPHEIEIDTLMPKVRFASLSILNQDVYPGDTIEGSVPLKRPVWETNQLKLNYKQNTFAIGFYAFPFDVSNSNHFRYRLLGLNDVWTISTRIQDVAYTKLPPGNYLFQVQAANKQSGYGPVSELQISVIPPFWMTIWFRFLLVGLIALLVLLFFLNRIQQIKKRNQWLNIKVKEQTAELREQNQTILKMSEELQEANESKLRFFTNVSHEFRTPLTIILGHIEQLRLQPKNSVDAIQKNAKRLLRLVDQLIDLRKIDRDQLSLNCSQFDLVAFIDEVIRSIEVVAAQKDIKISFDPHKPSLLVCLDADMMEKILFNLLSNAIKYSLQGKNVRVETSSDADSVSIKIADKGIGIAETDKQHIFDRFYRAKSENVHAGGYGIGLALVKGLVEMQKGTIDVESQLGMGSVFTVCLPVKAHDPAPGNLVDPHFEFSAFDIDSADEIVWPEKLSGKKILIVEDHPDLLEFLCGILGADFKIETAANGKEGLDKLEEFIPDLIISDVMMPVMDGMSFCRKVKASIETSHIPFILLTAKSGIDDKIEGFELGVDDYIEKPFSSKVLIARIKTLLSNRQKLIDDYLDSAKTIPTTKHLSQRDKVFLERTDQCIFSNIDNQNFSVDVLGSELGMSRASFYRKFTELTGNSPAEYIRKVRLRKAHNLLRTINLSIAQISEQSGFQSVSHFRKAFKGEFGKTPSEIQKNK
jgi:signal transduction histidine kinase/DNA-binding response OmpR family regulator/ligand-binding sensor domain-containing protein